MSTATDVKYIVRDPDVYGGKPCIEGHHIAVHDIALARYFHGYTPEEIVSAAYPTLTLAQVYAALLYDQDHKDEIDREIADEATEIKASAQADTSPLARKIRRAVIERKAQSGE